MCDPVITESRAGTMSFRTSHNDEVGSNTALDFWGEGWEKASREAIVARSRRPCQIECSQKGKIITDSVRISTQCIPISWSTSRLQNRRVTRQSLSRYGLVRARGLDPNSPKQATTVFSMICRASSHLAVITVDSLLSLSQILSFLFFRKTDKR